MRAGAVGVCLLGDGPPHEELEAHNTITRPTIGLDIANPVTTNLLECTVTISFNSDRTNTLGCVPAIAALINNIIGKAYLTA